MLQTTWARSAFRIHMILGVLLCFGFNTTHAVDTVDHSELWRAVEAGTHVAIIRHALAPGFGDPDEFDLEDCTTQRNLSDVGRDQARRIGDLFRENGMPLAQVMTSQWCRCRETAALMGLGDPVDLPALNSFFQARELGPEQTRALQTWLRERQPGLPLVLVTHQVNITALTGLGASSGEILVFRITDNSDIDVLGRIATL